ncbi:MAG: FG-GAP repeat protein [Candidatus Sumerlaeia bacterium]|nr:FG-GAP repeat protein [Candidatus Sumerlaeia bacterium]
MGPRFTLLALVVLCALRGSAGPVTAPTFDAVDLALVAPPFRAVGGEDLSGFGYEMVLGDMNGDGRDDLAVAAPFAGPGGRTGAGTIHIFDGTLLSGSIDLGTSSATSVVLGEQGGGIENNPPGDAIGEALAMGDFNDDGFDDLAIGAPNLQRGADPSELYRPTIFLLWGEASLQPVYDLASPGPAVTLLVASPERQELGGTSSGFGFTLAAGDFDGDGIDDLMAGAPFYANSLLEVFGRADVIFGRPDFPASGLIDIDDLPPAGHLAMFGTVPGASAGWTVAAGDFDGDGFDDCAVSAPDTGFGQPFGHVFIVYGRADKPASLLLSERASAPFDLTAVNADAVAFPEARLGESLGLGYHGADLFADLMIGAPGGIFGLEAEAAYLIQGAATRVGSIDLAGPLGGRFTRFEGTGPGEDTGWRVALADLNGDGLDDPIITAPRDGSADGQTPIPNRGVVYAPLSGGLLSATPVLLLDSGPAMWSFSGPSADHHLGDSLATGGLDEDAVMDLFLGTPFPLTPAPGEVLAFPSIDIHPRLRRATVAEQTSIDLALSPGDQILLTFDHSVTVASATLQPGDFYLSNPGATLGTDAAIAPSTERSNVLIITLGSTFANLVVPGDDPATSTFIDLGPSSATEITDPTTGAAAVDNGIARRPEDAPVDLRWRYSGQPAAIGPAGGSATVAQNAPGGPIDFQYTRHRFDLPPGALNPGVTATYQFQALSTGVASQGQTSGVRILSDMPEIIFNTPGLLTVEYLDDDIDVTGGQVEGLLRLVAVETASGFPFQRGLAPSPVLPLGQASQGNTLGATLPSFLTQFGFEPGTFATIPVNPVEERSLFLAPGSGEPASLELLAPLLAAGPTLAPGSGSAYVRHLLEFPGRTQVAAGTPGATQIRIRTATLFERTHPAPQAGANLFPGQSAAVFVVNTLVDGLPVAYAAPVNVDVQYISRADMALTDVVDFAGNPGDPSQMRLVRSRVDFLLGPDFQFVAGAQAHDAALGVVAADGVTGLTDANGTAVWGAVVNPAIPPPPLTLDALVGHLLGNAPLSGLLLLQADLQPDGVVDAADVVRFLNDTP